MSQEQNTNREDQLDIKMQDILLNNKKLSKLQAKKVAKWYFKRTGKNHQSCMCTTTQRNEMRDIGISYINTLNRNMDND